jgi:hypothetical protein
MRTGERYGRWLPLLKRITTWQALPGFNQCPERAKQPDANWVEEVYWSS